MIRILVIVRRGGPRSEADAWMLQTRQTFVATASRLPADDRESGLLRTAVHRACIASKLMGDHVPVFETLAQDPADNGAGAALPGRPFYVADVSLPTTEAAVPASVAGEDNVEEIQREQLEPGVEAAADDGVGDAEAARHAAEDPADGAGASQGEDPAVVEVAATVAPNEGVDRTEATYRAPGDGLAPESHSAATAPEVEVVSSQPAPAPAVSGPMPVTERVAPPPPALRKELEVLNLPRLDRPTRQVKVSRVEKSALVHMDKLIVRAPTAARVLLQLIRLMEAGSGGVVPVTRTTLASLLETSVESIEDALRLLCDGRLVRLARVGSAEAVVVNAAVAWTGAPHMVYEQAVFDTRLNRN